MNKYNRFSIPVFLMPVFLIVCLFVLSACSNTKPVASAADSFVKVSGTHFQKDGQPYYIAGTNMWYAAYLGSPGKVGDHKRLAKELDALKAMGVNNLRVLAVSEKSDINSSVKPATTNGFGNYDESLLQGLDYLLVELANRDDAAFPLRGRLRCSDMVGTN